MEGDLQYWQNWLYGRLDAYERSGRKALHPTLSYMQAWDERLGHPHRQYPIIHIAGTNGKGSTSAFLASVLMAAGYKVGLHTSPHLWRFTERMRVQGQEPPTAWVDSFLKSWHKEIEALQLSFFEATVGMSLAYFAEEKVDIAIVEVGLGGTWDATNIVSPEVAVITPIGLDHVEILGPTLRHIAREKAGIIKPNRPVVSAPSQAPEALAVLEMVAQEKAAPFYEATPYLLEPEAWVVSEKGYLRVFKHPSSGKKFISDLTGDYQAINIATVWQVVEMLRKQGWSISEEALNQGIAQAQQKAPLYGRAQWLRIGEKWILADVAHNPHGFAALRKLLDSTPIPMKDLLIGFSRDKDVEKCLEALGPWPGRVFFTAARSERALPADTLRSRAERYGYQGRAYPTLAEALNEALSSPAPLLITGSVFVVGEALTLLGAVPHE